MANIFLISDTHWGHKGVCEFLNDDGTKLRPWDNYTDMDEAMIANWNSVVGPKDKVYHLGDVVINRRAFPTLSRLNGEKVLIKGNHDIFRLEEYTPYFKDIRGTHKLDNMLLSHIPVHPDSLARWCGGNAHGHLHSNRVMLPKFDTKGNANVDPRYFCASVEQINYTPISFEEVKRLMKEQQA